MGDLGAKRILWEFYVHDVPMLTKLDWHEINPYRVPARTSYLLGEPIVLRGLMLEWLQHHGS